jgi:hypothetical protein
MQFSERSEARSRQLAPGFVAESLQVQRTLGASAVRELPGGEVLYACLLAGLIFCALPWRATFNVVDILKGVAEEFFLILTVRAPPRAIHFRAAFTYTLCEAIQCADRLAVVGKIIDCPCCDSESNSNPQPNKSWRRRGSRGLVFARIRHCAFLYHDIEGAGQHVKAFAKNCDDLAVDHHIHRIFEVKIYRTSAIGCRVCVPS